MGFLSFDELNRFAGGLGVDYGERYSRQGEQFAAYKAYAADLQRRGYRAPSYGQYQRQQEARVAPRARTRRAYGSKKSYAEVMAAREQRKAAARMKRESRKQEREQAQEARVAELKATREALRRMRGTTGEGGNVPVMSDADLMEGLKTGRFTSAERKAAVQILKDRTATKSTLVNAMDDDQVIDALKSDNPIIRELAKKRVAKSKRLRQKLQERQQKSKGLQAVKYGGLKFTQFPKFVAAPVAQTVTRGLQYGPGGPAAPSGGTFVQMGGLG